MSKRIVYLSKSRKFWKISTSHSIKVGTIICLSGKLYNVIEIEDNQDIYVTELGFEVIQPAQEEHEFPRPVLR